MTTTSKLTSGLAAAAVAIVLAACSAGADPGLDTHGQALGSGGFRPDAATECLECMCGACGNGALDAGEACDDGNRDGGDGCSASCDDEACGNGVVDVGEQCEADAPLVDLPCSDECTW